VVSSSVAQWMLGGQPVVHHIVQIGGIPGASAPHLRTAASAKTWLIVADPDAARELRARLHRTRTTVIGAALAAQPGPFTWHVQVPQAFSGPHPLSKALRDRCPGVIERGSRVVDGLGVGEFIAALPQPRRNAAAALVIDMRNGAADLVCALDADALHRYDWIVVRLAKEVDFECAATDRHVREHLTLCGFRCTNTNAADEALFPLHYFAIDRAGIENARLQRTIDTLEGQLVEAKDAAASARGQVQHQSTVSAQLATQVSRLTAQLAQAQREAERCAATLALRESELASAADLATQVSRLNGKLSQVQREAERSATMLALRDSDLRDLQQRYEEAVRLQDAYRDALRELAARVRDWLDRPSGAPAA
jgi:hypothetical protein